MLISYINVIMSLVNNFHIVQIFSMYHIFLLICLTTTFDAFWTKSIGHLALIRLWRLFVSKMIPNDGDDFTMLDCIHCLSWWQNNEYCQASLTSRRCLLLLRTQINIKISWDEGDLYFLLIVQWLTWILTVPDVYMMIMYNI